MAVCDNVLRLRLENNKTQKEVAPELGISQPMYSLYEAGKRPMPRKHIIASAKLYNVPISAIDDKHTGTAAPAPLPVSEKELYERMLAQKDIETARQQKEIELKNDEIKLLTAVVKKWCKKK